ncbi:winged helix-turn-helix domain-containing protein [Catellatospora aurea]|uniref:Winged helix-turn-helix domain-containing protein n=1 Tax=Catellatospora aurea TaxID=1337874 RepID=A0ABW2H980_9ACTN
MTSDAAFHPTAALDETVHQRVRLGVLAVLSEVAECAFTVLRDELALTDGNLSRHVRMLEEAGMVAVRKGYEGRRPCTWLRLTSRGSAALRTELAALEAILKRHGRGTA